jgi:hypothetical protein
VVALIVIGSFVAVTVIFAFVICLACAAADLANKLGKYIGEYLSRKQRLSDPCPPEK